MRGNNVMKGYFDEPEATAEAFRGGWFHSGDLAVLHPDGYIELRDRKKDIIISGGENISTIEVEQASCAHPAVLECAVVADPRREVGRAAQGVRHAQAGRRRRPTEEIIEFCREHIAHFKCPARRRVRRPAEDLDRQDAEVRPARAGVGRAREADRRRVAPGSDRRYRPPRWPPRPASTCSSASSLRRRASRSTGRRSATRSASS